MSDDFKINRRERYVVRDDDGAGYGNRTRLFGLGSRHTTDVLILRMKLFHYISTIGLHLQAKIPAEIRRNAQ